MDQKQYERDQLFKVLKHHCRGTETVNDLFAVVKDIDNPVDRCLLNEQESFFRHVTATDRYLLSSDPPIIPSGITSIGRIVYVEFQTIKVGAVGRS